MTPFTKRNLLIPVTILYFVGLLYGMIKYLPTLRGSIQHLEIIAISFMILISLSVMFFWITVGTFAGLFSLLFTLIFLYRHIMDLNPYYYSVLILAFFISSFIGHRIRRDSTRAMQEYTVDSEKVFEDTNLIKDHFQNRTAEVRAMEVKINSFVGIKSLADKLSTLLSLDDVIKVAVESAFSIFKGRSRVMLYLYDSKSQEMNLVHTVKAEDRRVPGMKKGGIFDRWVMKNMKALLVRDISKDFRFSVTGDEREEDFLSLISKPLISENNLLGILRVDSPDEAAFDQHELRMLDFIGELAAVAIENARLFRQTEELAVRDSLTGLYVHRYFMERLEEEVKRALRSSSSFALLMMDIDNFKDFNDRHGHIAGDMILKNIGKILKSHASAGDTVCRYGGEEFAFILLDADKKKALETAHAIRKEVQETSVTIRREKKFITISIGVASFPKDAKLKDDIILEADKYLYKAKAKGKNTVFSK